MLGSIVTLIAPRADPTEKDKHIESQHGTASLREAQQYEPALLVCFNILFNITVFPRAFSQPMPTSC